MPDILARHLITCDCCGKQGLAELHSHAQGLTLKIRARRHGVWHEVTLDMEVLARFDVTDYADTDVHGDIS